MACYHPIDVYQVHGEDVRLRFGVPSPSDDVRRVFKIPCNRCVGCRLRRSSEWALRCVHEAALYKANSFITLTYDNDHLPSAGSLHYPDFKGFIKRLNERLHRSGLPRVRYYMAGEYGALRSRPHYHACIFGYDFPDKHLWQKTPSGSLIYRSDLLEEVWPFGHSSVGDLTYQSAAYTARYVMKKVFGDDSQVAYLSDDFNLETGECLTRVPEFNRMSLKPGIGARWFEKYQTSVYPHDFLVHGGRKYKPPRYYDVLYERIPGSDIDYVRFERTRRAEEISARPQPSLDSQESVAARSAALLVRPLENDLCI